MNLQNLKAYVKLVALPMPDGRQQIFALQGNIQNASQVLQMIPPQALQQVHMNYTETCIIFHYWM